MIKKIYFFLIFVFLASITYAERYQIPFTNLPKISKDKNVEFVKVLSKKYKILSDGNMYIDYIIRVLKNNIKDLFVEDIVSDNFVFYINNDLGRLLTKEEKERVLLSVVKDKNGDFIVNLRNVSNKVFRLDIDVLVVYKNIKLVTVLELLDYEAFPVEPKDQFSFFDDKDISIGKLIIIEK